MPAGVGQGAHDPVLGGELGIEEQQVLGRGHPHHQWRFPCRRGAGAAENRLVGEPVGGGSLDIEDLGGRAALGLGRQPAGQDGGDLLGVVLVDVGHGAGV